MQALTHGMPGQEETMLCKPCSTDEHIEMREGEKMHQRSHQQQVMSRNTKSKFLESECNTRYRGAHKDPLAMGFRQPHLGQ